MDLKTKICPRYLWLFPPDAFMIEQTWTDISLCVPQLIPGCWSFSSAATSVSPWIFELLHVCWTSNTDHWDNSQRGGNTAAIWLCYEGNVFNQLSTLFSLSHTLNIALYWWKQWLWSGGQRLELPQNASSLSFLWWHQRQRCFKELQHKAIWENAWKAQENLHESDKL